jgi:ribonuclease R
VSKKDPFYARESEKYSFPVPSREYILQTLEEFGRPMARAELLVALEVEDDASTEALAFRLRAMLRDGQLMQDRRNRYCLLDRINLMRGKIYAHADGFGFFMPEDGSKDLLLSPKEMRQVMHGDIVLAYKTNLADKKGRFLGKIHEVIEHTNVQVVGRYFSDCGVNFVVPDSKHLTQDIAITPGSELSAQDGQIVVVEILSYPKKHSQAIGKVTRILGDHMAPGMEIKVAILSHGIPDSWPQAVLDELRTIPMTVSSQDLDNRLDLRNLSFVTIDGEDAKDFDDAVYCEPLSGGGHKLLVAIADVSHYVKVGSALDIEAQKRGTSVYFPGHFVVPMLPEELSNGICSLKPGVDRLCMVAEMHISSAGKIVKTDFYSAVIHSQARLTYTKAFQWLNDNEPPRGFAKVWPSLTALYHLYKILLNTRQIRGALDFDSIETRIIFDQHSKIKQIMPVQRNEAHRLIEECMLAANVSVAKAILQTSIPSLYRVHLAPDDDKMTSLRSFLGEFGLSFKLNKKPQPKDFQQILAGLHNKPEKHLIESVLLKSLKQAHYTESNEGHFGLAYNAYTHFTSPIRRYPDLLIHRALKAMIDNKLPEDFEYSLEDMSRFGKNCSMTERRADDATREVVSWLKCEYMQDKLGAVYKGHISAVTGFGLFVTLDDVYVEGLVHVTSLKSDYYSYDSVKHRLVGTRGGLVYALGDSITVLVASVDLDERKIDFELA